jgi:hypothetical protein
MDLITESDAALVHVHARTLAAAQIAALGSFDATDIAEEALRLWRATRAEVAKHNALATEVSARVEARIGGQSITPPMGVPGREP